MTCCSSGENPSWKRSAISHVDAARRRGRRARPRPAGSRAGRGGRTPPSAPAARAGGPRPRRRAATSGLCSSYSSATLKRSASHSMAPMKSSACRACDVRRSTSPPTPQPMAVVELLDGIDVERSRFAPGGTDSGRPTRSPALRSSVSARTSSTMSARSPQLVLGGGRQPAARGPAWACGSSSSSKRRSAKRSVMPATWSVTRVATSPSGVVVAHVAGVVAEVREEAAHDEAGAGRPPRATAPARRRARTGTGADASIASATGSLWRMSPATSDVSTRSCTSPSIRAQPLARAARRARRQLRRRAARRAGRRRCRGRCRRRGRRLDDAALERLGRHRAGVVEDAVAHLEVRLRPRPSCSRYSTTRTNARCGGSRARSALERAVSVARRRGRTACGRGRGRGRPPRSGPR